MAYTSLLTFQTGLVSFQETLSSLNPRVIFQGTTSPPNILGSLDVLIYTFPPLRSLTSVLPSP